MKNKLLIVLIAFVVVLNANAQSDNYPNTVSLDIGFSLVGGIVDLLDSDNFSLGDVDNIPDVSDLRGSIEGSSNPAFQVAYDRSLTNWFSVGLGLSFQQMDLSLNDVSYFDEEENQEVNIGTGSLDINRVNVGIRALFHYGNKGKMDLYSGIRLGLTSWGLNVSSADANFEQEVEDFSLFGVNPAVQIIPFALRGYLTENIGLNFEFAVGAPHFFALGLNYRL